METRRQEYARSVVGQPVPPARESGTDVFDTLLDPWQLACTVLVIALVLLAGWWYGRQSGSREVGKSGSEADDASVANGAK
jgi:hypothetical protein